MIHGNELILPALPQSDSEIDRQTISLFNLIFANHETRIDW